MAQFPSEVGLRTVSPSEGRGESCTVNLVNSAQWCQVKGNSTWAPTALHGPRSGAAALMTRSDDRRGALGFGTEQVPSEGSPILSPLPILFTPIPANSDLLT